MTSQRMMTLGIATGYSQTDTGLEIQYANEKVGIDVIKADLVRIRISRGGAFDESPTHALAINPLAEGLRTGLNSAFVVEDEMAVLRLRTSSLIVEIELNDFGVRILRVDGTSVLAGVDGGFASYYKHLNNEFVSVRGAKSEDPIYGLGEKTGGQNRRGRDFVLWNNDVLNPTSSGEFTAVLDSSNPRSDTTSVEFDPYYMSIPFFYHQDSTTGNVAGFFLDNGYRGTYDFKEADKLTVSFEGGQLAEYVFAGPKMPDILKDYTWLTGTTPLPPLWSLGYHQCRWFAYDSDALLALAKRHQELDIPLDVLWLDIDHMDGYRVFTWNTKLFPDIQGTLAELREMGIRVITIIDPGVKVDPGYSVYDSGLAEDVFCKTEGGNIYVGQVWPGSTAFPDFATAKARSWWGQLNAQHVENGLAGIWNDMNEPATGEISPLSMRFGDAKYAHERFHNSYALLMAMGTVEGLNKAMPDLRTFVLSRAGSAGIQRYAANWLGDNMSRWDHLRLSISMATGLSLSGQSFVGADIGGFGEDSSPELFARWIQYGALTPFARNHNVINQIDQYVFSFGDEITEISKAAIKLRYQLMPYLYTQFVHCSESGEPIQRPLVFDYQSDYTTREIDDQFLLGRSLLIAPVVTEGEVNRKVYLPTGEWFDWHDDVAHTSDSGLWLEVHSPLARVPMFVKTGSIIPTWFDAPTSLSGSLPSEIELQVWIPTEDGVYQSVLQEDDGLTFGWRRSEFVRTDFILERYGESVTIRGSVSGRGYPGFSRKSFVFKFRGENARSLEPIQKMNRGESFELTVKVG